MKTMKKIAIVSHGLSNGGAERVASILANELDIRGYKVIFIAAYSKDREYELNESVKYRYVNVSKKNKVAKLISRSRQINSIIRDFAAEVVISFVINECLITTLRKRIPIIYTLRIDPSRKFKDIKDRVIGLNLYRMANAIVCQTNGAKDFFEEKIRKKSYVIANPIKDNLPYWKQENAKNQVITACRLSEQKNIPMLIDGFEILHSKFPNYRLIICGDGEEREYLEQYVNEKALEDCIDFLGHRTDIHELIKESSIFALTSNYEGLSNSMLEALAMGIPCVCTDCPPGGAADFINDKVNGYLVGLNDSRALGEIFVELASNPEVALKVSRNTGSIRMKLDKKSIIDSWINVIEKV